MNPEFDGEDELRIARERTVLRTRIGMHFSSTPLAVRVGDEWQIWWRDGEAGMWFRKDGDEILQMPLNGDETSPALA